MMKVFHLVIEDQANPWEGAKWVETFLPAETVKDPLDALRMAVKEYCSSDDGEKQTEHNSAFNWGDAMLSVPDQTFMKHGMMRLRCQSSDAFVDHDAAPCCCEETV